MKIDIEQLVLDFNLGKIIKLDDFSDYPGALNKVYFLKTPNEEYLIKKINPNKVNNDILKKYNLTEKIAESFSNNNVPCVFALKFNDSFIHQVNNNYYLFYPYIEAKYTAADNLTDFHLKTAAKLFTKIHSTKISIDKNLLGNLSYTFFDNESFKSKIEKSNLPILKNHLDIILKANTAYLDALPYAKKNLVVSHRDLHAKNILWDKKQRPYIIDWETAGYVNPLSEVFGYGFEWAGLYRSTFSEDKYISFLQAYAINKSLSENEISKLIDVYIGNAIINWLEFNINRVIIPDSYDTMKDSFLKKEYEKGLDIITNGLIPYLIYFDKNKNYLINLIQQCINKTK